jgi:hypothetical protein
MAFPEERAPIALIDALGQLWLNALRMTIIPAGLQPFW